MELTLGIDLGATACAVARQQGAQVEVCPVGEHGTTMPAATLSRRDGTTLVGEAADHASPYEPTLVNRLVASRLDEPGPTVVDGQVYEPLALTEALLAALVDRAGPAPDGRQPSLVLTYPLRSGRAVEDLLTTAAANVTGSAPTLVPEPVAAVAHAVHSHDLGADAVLAVVDVGGSSSDVTLVHRTPTSFDLVGEPASLPGFGGTDLDATVLTLVESAIGDVTSMVSTADVAGMLALRRLRAACRRAKERLSSAPETVVEVALRHARGHVEITRRAFERTVEPDLVLVADLVATTIEGAGLIPADLGGLVLTGGSAPIPLLAELLSTRTGLSVTVADEPDLATALGAALFGDGGAVDIGDTGELVAPLAGPSLAPSLLSASDPPPPAPSLLPPSDPPAPGLPPPAPSLLPPSDPPAPDLAPEPIVDRWWDDAAPAGVPAGAMPDSAGWDDTGAGGWAADDAPVDGPIDAPVDAPVDAPWPWEDGDAVAERPRADARWDDPDGPGPGDPAGDAPPWAADARPWDGDAPPWEDARTSVFAPPSGGPGPGGGTSDAGGDEAAEWGQTSDAEVRRLRTSDTDPFGSRGGSLGHRHRVVSYGSGDDADDDAWDDDEDRPSVDPRIVIGGGVAAALALVVGAYGFLSSAGSDDTGLAIAESGITTTSAGFAEALANPAPSTSSTAAPTTSSSIEEPDDPSPPSTYPEATTPPTQPPTTPTQPPTTPAPTTTTRPRPTTTTQPPSSSSTTSTTECPTPTTPPTTDPGCEPGGGGNGPNLLDLFGRGR
jgi:actin-like ATPase involved in cell morphogenesis